MPKRPIVRVAPTDGCFVVELVHALAQHLAHAPRVLDQTFSSS